MDVHKFKDLNLFVFAIQTNATLDNREHECEVKGYIFPVFLAKIVLFLMFGKLDKMQFYLVLVQKIVAVRN